MKKSILIILDGWGLGNGDENDTIARVKPPFWNSLLQEYPHCRLRAKSDSVGLPDNCLSGSEVGHLIIGAGRVVWQNAARIDKAIEYNEFENNPVLLKSLKQINDYKSTLHLAGLLSEGGIHSSWNQIEALINWAKKNKTKTSLHLFLDGRDMPPKSALKMLEEKVLPLLDENISLSTLCGRAVAMDRSENWDRTETIYKLLTEKKEITTLSPIQFIENQYQNNITDEFVEPQRFDEKTISDNDVILFFNFRADRMRQLTRLFSGMAPNTVQDDVNVPINLFIGTMTEYDKEIKNVSVLYPPEIPANGLGEWISKQNLKQFRIAETEKYAHVTYFFNGGHEAVFPGEERLVIPSLGLTNYASNPEMSLPEVTTSLNRALDEQKYDLVICNLANGDMIGHTGNKEAAETAIKIVDESLQKIVETAQKNNYEIIITADHGNIECMYEKDEPHTAHTYNDVPFLILNKNYQLPETGTLSQISPTILKIMELPIPPEMTSEPMI